MTKFVILAISKTWMKGSQEKQVTISMGFLSLLFYIVSKTRF